VNEGEVPFGLDLRNVRERVWNIGGGLAGSRVE